ncbi:MAG: acyl-CoA thioesterase [Firmicutes bacterium]|nr:acyl-CoA thioesterase [Bacillota bacterium]
MKSGETFLRVRYKDTDQMGVAYYGNYFVWFEVGRTEFFRGLGMSYKELEQNNLYLPVIRASCQYKTPAHYDDLLKLVTRLSALSDVRLTFTYDIYREEKLLAFGETEHAFINQKGRPVVLRRQNPFLWRLLKDKVHESLESER